ncbi:MAG: DUF3789 domain-containing protein [Clostridiales bacterium]|nr:DUF3789 domain-containing protein [Candidatus Coliplasma equi]
MPKGILIMGWFLAGLLVGGFIGVVTMCIFQMAR